MQYQITCIGNVDPVTRVALDRASHFEICKAMRCVLFLLLLALIAGGCDSYEDGQEPSAEPQVMKPTYDRSEIVQDSWEDAAEIEDGTHAATVDYYNPSTGYSAIYDLDVEIEGGEVTTIYFPDGGWLDESQIYSAELDEEGSATVEAYDGRTFEIQIEQF